jgi:hypothetical protein
MTHLDLDDTEADALAKLLTRAIADDRSPQLANQTPAQTATDEGGKECKRTSLH